MARSQRWALGILSSECGSGQKSRARVEKDGHLMGLKYLLLMSSTTAPFSCAFVCVCVCFLNI